jgi:mannosyl-oligosaccharide alpha-1,2-mannosidase
MQLSTTAVDALSTLWVMGLKEEFREVEEKIVTQMDFQKADSPVSLFEVNIRVLGGLLSAYELSGTDYIGHHVFLSKAQDLGYLLLSTFSQPGQFPPTQVILSESRGIRQTHACYITQWGPVHCPSHLLLAEFGTLALEFSALSYHTHDQRYDQKANELIERLDTYWMDRFPLFPGFFAPEGSHIEKYSFAGGADSFYEYLLKEYIHSNRSKPRLKFLYERSVHGLIDYLVQQDTTGLLYISELINGETAPKMDHLACFLPGLLIYGAIHLPSQQSSTVLETAKSLSETCRGMYLSTVTHLAPETSWFSHGISRDQLSEHHYALRPEAFESWFYMYRYTHDPRYRVWGWEAFQVSET